MADNVFAPFDTVDPAQAELGRGTFFVLESSLPEAGIDTDNASLFLFPSP
jgi:hypothetical protein